MKQETLEEILKNEIEFIHNSVRNYDFDLGFKTGGLIGAKWQQERSYSEEEVNVLISLLKGTTEYEVLQSFRDKIEQFKKK